MMTLATASRARALISAFVEASAAEKRDAAEWHELADTLTALEQEADSARRRIAEWQSKANHALAKQRRDLADEAQRRAAGAEQEFAAYLGEIAGIWAFLENGVQTPLSAPQDATR
jgi:hypothetical protein